MNKILLISNDNETTKQISYIFHGKDYNYNNISENNINDTEKFDYDIVILDIKLNDDYITLIKKIKSINKELEILIITDCPCDYESISQAYEEGIIFYIQRNHLNKLIDLIIKTLNKKLYNSQLKNVVQILISALEDKTKELKLRKKAEKKLEDNLKEARESHAKLQRIQYPKIHNIRFYSDYKPYELVGGDFFNIIQIDDKIIFYICDISGHGIETAIIASSLKSTIDFFINQEKIDSPDHLLKLLINELSKKTFFNENLMTILIGIIDINLLTFHYISAGHLQPIIFNKKILTFNDQFKINRPITNILPINSETSLINNAVNLKNDYKILLFSDGLIEWINEDGVFKGMEGFKEYINNNGLKKLTINRYIDEIKKNIEDDISYILIEVYDKYEKLYYCTLNEYSMIIEDIEDEIKNRYANEKKIYRSIQCFTEIITNAIEHGNKNQKHKKIIIKLEFYKDYIVFSAEDEGNGFDWKDKDFNTINEKNEIRGRGLFIIARNSDKIEFNEKGNLIKVKINMN